MLPLHGTYMDMHDNKKKERHEEHSIGKNVAKVKLPIQGDKPVEISQ